MRLIRRDLPYIVLICLLLAAMAAYDLSKPHELHGMVMKPSKPMPDFTLQSAQGPVSLSSFRNKVVVLYFGYTSCPDVCPFTLANLRQTMSALGDKAKDVQVIFISVDWKRDTPEIMARYVANFNRDFLGLAGTQSQIDSVTKDFGIFYVLNPPDENGYYSVDHNASIRVLDRLGRLVVIWPNDTKTSEMTTDLEMILSTN